MSYPSAISHGWEDIGQYDIEEAFNPSRHMTDLRLDQRPESQVERIDADLLIPGKGEPIKNGTLIIKNGKIEYAGSQKDTPIEYVSLQSKKVPVLMPGMWDCHVKLLHLSLYMLLTLISLQAHFLGFDSLQFEIFPLMHQALAGARVARDAAAFLNAGFTSARELLGYGFAVSKAINEGYLPGPNIYSSVAAISMTAGHADMFSLPQSLVKEKAAAGVPLAVCDGVPACIQMVRTMIRQGAQVIKIHATGGVLSIIDSPESPQFSPEEIEAMVQEAERADIIIAAHCHGKRGIMNALNAGVKTIEHGTGVDDEVIAVMKAKGAILVATRTIAEHLIAHLGEMQPEQRKKALEVANRGKANYANAIRKGVSIALGTDLGISSLNTELRHGTNGKEFYYATVAGMTPLEAIEAGTATAPLTLGPRAPMSGQLKKGYDADVLGLDENPLEDIKILADAEKIKYVWKGGKLYKSPGKPMSIFI